MSEFYFNMFYILEFYLVRTFLIQGISVVLSNVSYFRNIVSIEGSVEILLIVKIG